MTTKKIMTLILLVICLQTFGQESKKLKKVTVNYFLDFETQILKDSTYPTLITDKIFLTNKNLVDTIKSRQTLDSMIWIFNKYPSLLCDGKLYVGDTPAMYTKMRHIPEGDLEFYLDKKKPPGTFTFFAFHCGPGSSQMGATYNFPKDKYDKTLRLVVRLYSRDLLDKSLNKNNSH